MPRMLFGLPVAILLVLTLSSPVQAQALDVMKTQALAGSPAATWGILADYCGIADWHPVVASCEIVLGTNNMVGAVRVLTTGDGAVIREELTAYDPQARTYSYRILESPLPVASYSATITVLAGSNGGSVVEWKSTFDAAPGADAATARAAIEGIYDAGFESLRAR